MTLPLTQPLTAVSELGRCLVTGAAGFLGRNMVEKLLNEGCQVVAIINQTPLNISHKSLTQVHANICDPSQLEETFKGIDTVFHMAAKIALMGGKCASRRYKADAWETNVTGTQNVIRACQKQGVKRLIYTSSVDVCFDGKPLPEMTESLPYASNPKSVYAQTKIEAEKQVLAANASNGLKTCAIRPDGIYGAQPNEMIDSFYHQIKSGALKARLGNPKTKQDNSHVDNVIHGELLAAVNLLDDGVACGQAYFIGDNNPLNTFDFFKPLIEGLGEKVPTKIISEKMLKPIAHVWQGLHFLTPIDEPLLVPHVLDKITVTHYASIKKAQDELGYEPVISHEQAMAECVEYCLAK